MPEWTQLLFLMSAAQVRVSALGEKKKGPNAAAAANAPFLSQRIIAVLTHPPVYSRTKQEHKPSGRISSGSILAVSTRLPPPIR